MFHFLCLIDDFHGDQEKEETFQRDALSSKDTTGNLTTTEYFTVTRDTTPGTDAVVTSFDTEGKDSDSSTGDTKQKDQADKKITSGHEGKSNATLASNVIDQSERPTHAQETPQDDEDLDIGSGDYESELKQEVQGIQETSANDDADSDEPHCHENKRISGNKSVKQRNEAFNVEMTEHAEIAEDENKKESPQGYQKATNERLKEHENSEDIKDNEANNLAMDGTENPPEEMGKAISKTNDAEENKAAISDENITRQDDKEVEGVSRQREEITSFVPDAMRKRVTKQEVKKPQTETPRDRAESRDQKQEEEVEYEIEENTSEILGYFKGKKFCIVPGGNPTLQTSRMLTSDPEGMNQKNLCWRGIGSDLSKLLRF